MSLVICANDSSETTIAGRSTSIYKANSFRNALTSTMTLPVNCQVAMQSCKITLDGTIGIQGGRQVFYMYLGEYIVDGAPIPGQRDRIEECLSVPIRFELFPNDPSGTFTYEQMADEIQRVLNETTDDLTGGGTGGGLFHPCYTPAGTAATAPLSRVTIERDTDGAVLGYNIQIKYNATAVDVLLGNGLASADLVNTTGVDFCDRALRENGRFGGTDLTGDVVGAKKYVLNGLDVAGDGVVEMRLKNNVPEVQDTIGTTFSGAPVSPFNGGVTYNIEGCSNQVPNGGVNQKCKFMVGLSRFHTTPCPVANGGLDVKRLGPRDYFQGAGKRVQELAGIGLRDWDIYMDYGVCVNDDGILRVVQCVKGDNTIGLGAGNGSLVNDSPKLQNVDYTIGGTAAAPFNVPYDMAANASRFRTITFEVSGQRVKILMDAVTLLEFQVAPPAISQNPKPVCQTGWNMYPVMQLNLVGRQAGPAQTDFQVRMTKLLTVGGQGVYTTQGCQFQPSYYQTLMERNTDVGITQYRNLETRWLNINHAVLQYGIADAGTTKFTQIFPVIVVGPSTIYAPSSDANTRAILGLEDQTGAIDTAPPWLAQVVAGTLVSQSIISTNRPDSKSTKSIFVRLDNFQQETMNAGNGNPSRIIAHLPRFDGQNETGRLFFEPSTLVYLDLKNPNPLHVNQLDLSLVYADERLCDSLTGTTIIVLHFREKP